MKPNPALHRAAAFAPTQAAVDVALEEADRPTRDLLLRTAVLTEFSPELLARVAPRPAPPETLTEELTHHLYIEEGRGGELAYDPFTREALLSRALAEQRDEALRETCRVAAAYYRELADRAEGDEARRYRDRALYYDIIADPATGYAAWEAVWHAIPRDSAEYERRAALIRIAEEAWLDLADVPGAQVTTLIRKGWLAYDLGDWLTADESFLDVLGADPAGSTLDRLTYFQNPRAGELRDGRKDPVAEAETNVGLGYVQMRLGATGRAAGHFEKSISLVPESRARREPAAAAALYRALVGLGEACLAMGAQETIILRRLLLPAEERRLTLEEYRRLRITPPLADIALDRLLREAGRFFDRALALMPDTPQGESHRRRTEARIGRLLLEQGNWVEASVTLERARRQELLVAGPEVDDDRSASVGGNGRLANRLATINLLLGDCRLLAAAATAQPVPNPETRRNVEGTIFSQVFAEPERGPFITSEPQLDAAEAEAEARHYYKRAWRLWKEARQRAGQALAKRREGDLEALHADSPERRQRALDRYRVSLELFEQVGHPGEIALAQERLELLRDRVLPDDDLNTDPSLEPDVEQIVRVRQELLTQISLRATEDDALSPAQFRARIEGILAGRRRYFRYRLARQLFRWLGRTYRIVAGTLGLLIGLALALGLYLATPWLTATSRAVTGYAWPVPFLILLFAIVFTISVTDRWTALRRLAVSLIPRRLFWQGREQLAVDDVGLHWFDERDQLRQFLAWDQVVEVRSQEWNRFFRPRSPKGRQTVVYGETDVEIRFDHELRGYARLLDLIRRNMERIGEADRWRPPQSNFLHGNGLLLFVALVMLAVYAACPLVLIFAFVDRLAFLGPPIFIIANSALLVVLAGIVVIKFREWQYMHARFPGAQWRRLRRRLGLGKETAAQPSQDR